MSKHVQDSLLLKNHICIDYYRKPSDRDKSFKGVRYFCLSHAHHDHMVGLRTFVSNECNRVVCTETTKSLVQIMYPSMADTQFITANFGDCIKLRHTLCSSAKRITSKKHGIINDFVYVEMHPSYHCPGATMFLFYVKNSSDMTVILNTSDYRWHDSFRDHAFFKTPVDICYMDGSLYQVRESIPSFGDTLRAIQRYVTKCVENGTLDIKIDAYVLGIEYVLEEIVKHKIAGRRVKLFLNSHIGESSRGRQVQFVLENVLSTRDFECGVDQSHVNERVNRNCSANVHEDDDKYDTIWLEIDFLRKWCDRDVPERSRQTAKWIVPSCMRSMCKHKPDSKCVSFEYVQFCTHANRKENLLFENVVKNVNPNVKIIRSASIDIASMSCNIDQTK